MTAARVRLAVAGVLACGLAAAVPLGRWEQGRAVDRAADGIDGVLAAVGPDLAGPSLSVIGEYRGLTCLIYRAGGYVYARELCIDGEGRLVAATDASGSGQPRVWDLTLLPGRARQRIAPGVVQRAEAVLDRR